MGTVAEKLLSNSLSAALSSIEIYNKPDFKYREEIFTILNINAWELLLKAKIIKDANGNIEDLYIMRNFSPKLTRNGTPMTIEIGGAMNKVKLDSLVIANLNSLIEIRDTAVHFYNDKNLSYLIYTLGVASLKNYQKLIKTWFDKSLLDYNFYILPLAFSYNFKTIKLLELEKEPEAISNLIKSVSSIQSSLDQTSEFYFVCEVATEIKSAKKLTEETDFTTAIGINSDLETAIVIRNQNLIDRYPLSFSELINKVQKTKSGIKQNQVSNFIKDQHIKTEPKFSAYNFRTKKQEDDYKKTGILPKGIPSIYNDDAFRYIVENIEPLTLESPETSIFKHDFTCEIFKVSDNKNSGVA